MPRTLPRNRHDAELALRQFARAWGLLHDVLKPYFASHDISPSQWGVLRALQRAEAAGIAPLRHKDLGDRLLVRPPSVTLVVDRLERSGLVARRTLPRDRRAKSVMLTPRGRKLLTTIRRRHPERMRALLGDFTAQETRTLHRLMQRMADHLENMQRARRTTAEANR